MPDQFSKIYQEALAVERRGDSFLYVNPQTGEQREVSGKKPLPPGEYPEDVTDDDGRAEYDTYRQHFAPAAGDDTLLGDAGDDTLTIIMDYPLEIGPGSFDPENLPPGFELGSDGKAVRSVGDDTFRQHFPRHIGGEQEHKWFPPEREIIPSTAPEDEDGVLQPFVEVGETVQGFLDETGKIAEDVWGVVSGTWDQSAHIMFGAASDLLNEGLNVTSEWGTLLDEIVRLGDVEITFGDDGMPTGIHYRPYGSDLPRAQWTEIPLYDENDTAEKMIRTLMQFAMAMGMGTTAVATRKTVRMLLGESAAATSAGKLTRMVFGGAAGDYTLDPSHENLSAMLKNTLDLVPGDIGYALLEFWATDSGSMEQATALENVVARAKNVGEGAVIGGLFDVSATAIALMVRFFVNLKSTSTPEMLKEISAGIETALEGKTPGLTIKDETPGGWVALWKRQLDALREEKQGEARAFIDQAYGGDGTIGKAVELYNKLPPQVREQVDDILATHNRKKWEEFNRLAAKAGGVPYTPYVNPSTRIIKHAIPTEADNKLNLTSMLYNAVEVPVPPKGYSKWTKGLFARETERSARASGRYVTKYDGASSEIISDTMTDEAIAALAREGHSGSWYKENLTEAMKVTRQIHPEITSGSVSEGIFKLGLAITSNGSKIDYNFRAGEHVYAVFKETGHFPDDLTSLEAAVGGFGREGPTLVIHMRRANALIDDLGLDDFVKFLNTPISVGDLKKMGFKLSGEAIGYMTHGSAIFGPKIGGGFYQNLMGNFKPVTFDRWWMSSWGRWTGRSTETATKELKAKHIARFRAALGDDAFRIVRGQKTKVPKTDKAIIAAAKRNHKIYVKNHHLPRTEFNTASQRVAESHTLAIREQPANSTERAFMRETTLRAVEKLRALGHDVTPADFQAAVWYPEKELHGFLNIGRGRSGMDDYHAAALRLLKELQDAGKL